MGRALKNVRMGTAKVPKVANAAVPPHGSYCSPNAVPHIGNAVAIPGGNKAKRAVPKNSVALRKGR